MSELTLTEQLHQGIEAMLAKAESPPTDDPRIVALLGVAAELRNLPRADFRTRLKNELEREISMSTAKQSLAEPSHVDEESATKVREALRTVTPYLTVPDVFAEIEFVTKAFGAMGQVYGLGSAGGYHSEYRIGGSMVMIGGGGGKSKWQGDPAPASLHLYVEDVDETYQRSIEAGGTSVMAPMDMDYGERGAAIEDPGGNHWYLATADGPNYIPEGLPNLMPFFNPVGAPKLIQFLKEAFAAEEVAVYQSPDGIIHHAKIRIGDSIVETGEAHGPWQPRPMAFFLSIDDCDAWYARAVKAGGAASVSEPADQPYGRTATVRDPFGNTWYITSNVS